MDRQPIVASASMLIEMLHFPVCDPAGVFDRICKWPLPIFEDHSRPPAFITLTSPNPQLQSIPCTCLRQKRLREWLSFLMSRSSLQERLAALERNSAPKDNAPPPRIVSGSIKEKMAKFNDPSAAPLGLYSSSVEVSPHSDINSPTLGIRHQSI